MAYSKVERQLWSDEQFRRFSRDVRQMWVYLLTCEHSNRLGLFVIDPLYAAADLTSPDDRWTDERVLKAWRELYRAGWILYEKETRLLLIVNHFKHNTFENPNVAKGAVSELLTKPFSKPLWERFRKGLIHFLPLTSKRGVATGRLLLKAVDDRLNKCESNTLPPADINGLGNGLGNGLPNGFETPEPEPITTTPSVGLPPEDDTPEKDSKPKKPLVDRPEDWQPNATHARIAEEEGLDLDREVPKFCDDCDAKGRRYVNWDLGFCTWLRKARDFLPAHARRPRSDEEALPGLDTFLTAFEGK